MHDYRQHGHAEFKLPEPELVDKARAGIEELKRRHRGEGADQAPAANPINQHDED